MHTGRLAAVYGRPKGAEQTATGKDQFGTHTLTLKTPKILCAPASPSGAFVDDAPAR